MAIAIRTIAANEVNQTNLSATIPATAQVGDFALLWHAGGDSGKTFTPPSGWTTVGSRENTQSLGYELFSKILTSGDINTPLNVAQSGGGKHCMIFIVFSGVDTADPIASIATPALYPSITSSTRVSPVHTHTGFCVEFAATKTTAPPLWTHPSGFTYIGGITQSGSGSHSIGAAYSTTDLDGGNTWTNASTPQAGIFAVSLNEDAGDPPPADAGTEIHTWVGAPSHNSFEVKSKVDAATSVRLAVSTSESMTSPTYVAAETPTDGRVKHVVTGLSPNTRYYYQLADTPSGGSEELIGNVGTVRTLQTPGTAFSGTRKVLVGGCVATNAADQVALTSAIAWAPDWGLCNGDFTYSGTESTDDTQHSLRLDNQIAGVSALRELIRKGGMVRYCVSDHDCGVTDNGDSNNAWTAANIVAYKKVVPHGTLLDPGGTTTARDQQWQDGRVAYYMIDVRNTNRSPGSNADNSSKTLLGAAQKARLLNWLETNTAPFKVIISDVQWMGNADMVNKGDWWPAYTTERAEIQAAIMAAPAHVELWHGDSHLVGYATAAKNTWGGFPVLSAAPYNNTGGGRYTSTFSAYFNNSNGAARQYGRVTFTDDGTTITRTFTGWNAITDAQAGTVTNTVTVETDGPGITITMWNGTEEIPVSLTIWNGTEEVAATIEVV